MRIRFTVAAVAMGFALTTVALAGEQTESKTREKTGEPYRYQERYAHPPTTFCWPQPTILHAIENERTLDVYFRGQGFSIDDVDLETVRVNGIPPYSGPVQRVGRWLKTDCFIMRFLDASGFRPIPHEGIQSTYKVWFDLLNGEHIEFIGEYELVVMDGDLNFDGLVDIDDILFLTNYLFDDGPESSLWGESVIEIMDVNGDGVIDSIDIDTIITITGL